MVASDPLISANNISSELLRSNQKQVQPETVRKAVEDARYKSRTPRRKPFVNYVNKNIRLHFSKEYQNAPPEFWRNVLFSDESKYNIFGSDRRLRVWRRTGAAYNSKKKKQLKQLNMVVVE